MDKAATPAGRVGRGVPGNFMLNQHVEFFADRRTKRNRSRAAQRRHAVEDSRRES